jgi:chromate transporter
MSTADQPATQHAAIRPTSAEGGWGSGTPGEVFATFLRLGLSSFGGPVAHIGYFREALVVRRRWIDEESFADLVALCQFLPGPASSQLGFALGLLRGGGFLGGLAAWLGFTLPSGLLMAGCALGLASVHGAAASGALHGLKLVAVAVVAQALWGMARTLTPDRTRAGIALAVVMALVFIGGPLVQVGAIALGGVAGLALCRGGDATSPGRLQFRISRLLGGAMLAVFAVLLVGAPLLAAAGGPPATIAGDVRLFDAFYRSGALVFGGGHVVLPLLQSAVVAPGWVSQQSFLAGYGLAQAMPGPLFTLAAWLGAASSVGPGGWAGAGIALVAIFLPGLLLVSGMLPFWDALRTRPAAQAAMRGANAAVVGILAAAFYDPIWRGTVLVASDFALALAGFVALVAWRAPPWLVVISLAAAGATAGAFAGA